jgi:hypothetical protein
MRKLLEIVYHEFQVFVYGHTAVKILAGNRKDTLRYFSILYGSKTGSTGRNILKNAQK